MISMTPPIMLSYPDYVNFLLVIRSTIRFRKDLPKELKGVIGPQYLLGFRKGMGHKVVKDIQDKTIIPWPTMQRTKNENCIFNV